MQNSLPHLFAFRPARSSTLSPSRSFALLRYAAGLLAIATVPTAFAQNYYTSGHGDIGIELHGDHFHTHWHLNAGAMVNALPSAGGEYHPEDLVAWTTATQEAPAGSQNWLGLAEGSTVYRMGNNNYQPNLGFAAEEIGLESDWIGGGLTISLSDWTLPTGGNFAMISSSSLIFSTFDPTVTDAYQPDANEPDFNPLGNSFFIWAGDHVHYSFFFSNPGYYELTFTWTGTHLEHGFISITDTFGFQAGAIPEPSAWALILSGSASLGVLIARRRKRAA